MESWLNLTLIGILVIQIASARFLDQFKRAYDPFHDECGIHAEDRQGCGRNYNRIGEMACLARSCCWAPNDVDGSPECYLPLRMLEEKCDVKYEDKDDCGYYGITEGECNRRGCCYRPSPLPNDPVCFHQKKGEMRLVDGPDERSGRVEIKYEDEWGTVCDDLFGMEEAKVVCRNLGYESGEPKIESYYGEGSLPIMLDSLECKGDESTLADCPHQGWKSHDCSHSEDAGVRCYNGDDIDDESDEEDSEEYGYSGYGGSGYDYWEYRSKKKPSN